jgi:hypothetical protein
MYHFAHIELFYRARLLRLRIAQHRKGKAGQFTSILQLDRLLQAGDRTQLYRRLSS